MLAIESDNFAGIPIAIHSGRNVHADCELRMAIHGLVSVELFGRPNSLRILSRHRCFDPRQLPERLP
jgi:hypothetical protein